MGQTKVCPESTIGLHQPACLSNEATVPDPSSTLPHRTSLDVGWLLQLHLLCKTHPAQTDQKSRRRQRLSGRKRKKGVRKQPREETISAFTPADGRNNTAKSCLLSTTLALLSGMGARVIAEWGVKEHPGATFRYEKAFVCVCLHQSYTWC